mmetsp:Transcript_13943/g.33807  ORF Transcript_13943/g.33807 Transcript_13943/m.33807 type:complete len:226 (-) Transcript_13943:335-1012(-)
MGIGMTHNLTDFHKVSDQGQPQCERHDDHLALRLGRIILGHARGGGAQDTSTRVSLRRRGIEMIVPKAAAVAAAVVVAVIDIPGRVVGVETTLEAGALRAVREGAAVGGREGGGSGALLYRSPMIVNVGPPSMIVRRSSTLPMMVVMDVHPVAIVGPSLLGEGFVHIAREGRGAHAAVVPRSVPVALPGFVGTVGVGETTARAQKDGFGKRFGSCLTMPAIIALV